MVDSEKNTSVKQQDQNDFDDTKACMDTPVDALQFNKFINTCEKPDGPNEKLTKAFQETRRKGFD